MLRSVLPALLLFSLSNETELAFAPEPQSSWSTDIELVRTCSGGELSVVMGGQEVPSMYLPKLKLDNREALQVQVTDTIDSADDSGAMRLVRRFDTAHREEAGEFIQGEESADSWSHDQDSPLLDRTVAFERTGADGEFTPSIADDDETPIASLSELVALLPGARLTPDEAIEIGDTWIVDDESLSGFFTPVGNLDFEAIDGEVPVRATAGKLTLELESIEDGQAHVRIEGELSESSSREIDLERIPVTDGTGEETTTWSFEVEGALQWDLELGRCRSLALGGPGNLTIEIRRDESLEGPTYASQHAMEAEFSFELEADVPAAVTEAGAEK